jgi:hypothetical protein
VDGPLINATRDSSFRSGTGLFVSCSNSEHHLQSSSSSSSSGLKRRRGTRPERSGYQKWGKPPPGINLDKSRHHHLDCKRGGVPDQSVPGIINGHSPSGYQPGPSLRASSGLRGEKGYHKWAPTPPVINLGSLCVHHRD